jgi:predicted DNA-binding transcriptional regulator YafY
MSQIERLYRIEQMLTHKPYQSFVQIQETLEVSPATLKRDLTYLRDRLHVPVEYDRYHGGYAITQQGKKQRHAMPGLWFSASEMHALLAMHQLIAQMDTGGLLEPHIQPLMGRIESLLSLSKQPAANVSERVKLLVSSTRRATRLEHFQVTGAALMTRTQIAFKYLSRYKDAVANRTVSPQRLIHYRDNWYLDGWCHTHCALRRFSLDAMSDVTATGEAAHEVPAAQLDKRLKAGYGIFDGMAPHVAVLVFSKEAARWVANELWHPMQKMHRLPDGQLQLEVPYLNETELLMDIMRHGDQVQVQAPDTLRQQVRARLRRALAQYAQK